MNNDLAIWDAIYDLYSLLVDHVNNEDRYQRLFEDHKVIFFVLGIDKAKSFEKRSRYSLPFDNERNFRPEPDFIGVNHAAGIVTVVELKTPFVDDITTARQDGNRAKFKADAEGYISQATEYVESIRERNDAREVIKKTFGIKKIAAYGIVLIYGLMDENNAVLVSALASQRKIPTEVVFYDTLLDKLITHYVIPRRDVFTRPGWCFVFHAAFAEKQAYTKACLGEYGSGNKDRLSIILDKDILVFECLDSEKQLHRLFAPLVGKGPHYIRFEFSNDQDGIYMSLNVNNVEQDLRIGKRALKFDPDVSAFTLGANSQGDRGAAFLMLEHYLVNRTMDISEKLGSFHYFERKIQGKGKVRAIEFKPESYMIRLPSGDLVQEREGLEPIMRELEIK